MAWVCGMLGLAYDRRRWLGGAVTVVAGVFVLMGLLDALT